MEEGFLLFVIGNVGSRAPKTGRLQETFHVVASVTRPTLKRIGFFCFPIKHSTHTSAT